MNRCAQYVLLDTSHLNNLVKDSFSNDSAHKERASAFVKKLASKHLVPTLCSDHLEEMMRHPDESVVDQRVAFLTSIPTVAWIRSTSNSNLPGSIVDIATHEVSAALIDPRLTCSGIRQKVAQTIFCIGSGREAMQPVLDSWPTIQVMSQAGEQRYKVAAAIGHATSRPYGKLLISELLEMIFPRFDGHFSMIRNQGVRDEWKETTDVRAGVQAADR